MNDYGVLTEPGTVRIQRMLPGPIERVWAYLTESEKRRTWLASGEMEPQVGGQVHLQFHNSELTGKREPAPERYQASGCGDQRGPCHRLGSPASSRLHLERRLRGRVRADTHGSEVMLVVTHRQLEERPTLLSVAAGWHTHLGILRGAPARAAALAVLAHAYAAGAGVRTAATRRVAGQRRSWPRHRPRSASTDFWSTAAWPTAGPGRRRWCSPGASSAASSGLTSPDCRCPRTRCSPCARWTSMSAVGRTS